jgi:alcohol dehydrogenase
MKAAQITGYGGDEVVKIAKDVFKSAPSAGDVLVEIYAAGVSAYQGKVELLNLWRDQKMLIQGGGGGIGSIAIQLAKHIGAYVATTVRGEDIRFVKNLGADLVIDFEKTPFETQIYEYDAVFDTVGGDTYARSYGVLRVGGTVLSLLGQPNSELMRKHQVNAIYESTQVNSERLTKLAKYVDAGVIKAHIDRVFSLDEAAEALSYLKDGHPRGKVVIEIKEKVPNKVGL